MTEIAKSCSFMIWFLSFGLKPCKSHCLILLHKISPEWLDLLSSFFPQQFSIIKDTKWTNAYWWWVLVIFASCPWSQACFTLALAWFLISASILTKIFNLFSLNINRFGLSLLSTIFYIFPKESISKILKITFYFILKAPCSLLFTFLSIFWNIKGQMMLE